MKWEGDYVRSTGKDTWRNGCDTLVVTFLSFTEETEENMESLRQDDRCRDGNLGRVVREMLKSHEVMLGFHKRLGISPTNWATISFSVSAASCSLVF
jgi:hypothetical protein